MTTEEVSGPAAWFRSPAELFNLTNISEDCSAELEPGSGGNKVPGGLVALGTMLVIVASFISCFGVNLQKWAHNINEKLHAENPAAPVRPMYTLWRWWLGIICMVLGSLMDMSALPFVPLSRVAALGSATIVANVIVTPLFLKERLTKHDLIGCVITVCGTVVACLFGAGQEAELSSHCILKLFADGLFVTYFSLLFMGLGFLFWLIIGFKRKQDACIAAGIIGGNTGIAGLETVWVHDNIEKVRGVDVAPLCGCACVCCPRHPGASPRQQPGQAAGEAHGPGTDARRSAKGEVHHAHPDYITCFPKLWSPFVTTMGPQFYPCVHAIYAGTIGAQSVMFAKAVLLFLKNAIRGVETAHSVAYLFVFLGPMLFCLWNQVNFLNVALRVYVDAIFVLPVYQAMWISTGISSGLIFYQEYRSIKGLNIALFTAGIGSTLVGLGVLARRKSRSSGVRSELEDGDLREASPQVGPGAPQGTDICSVSPVQPCVAVRRTSSERMVPPAAQLREALQNGESAAPTGAPSGVGGAPKPPVVSLGDVELEENASPVGAASGLNHGRTQRDEKAGLVSEDLLPQQRRAGHSRRNSRSDGPPGMDPGMARVTDPPRSPRGGQARRRPHHQEDVLGTHATLSTPSRPPPTGGHFDAEVQLEYSPTASLVTAGRPGASPHAPGLAPAQDCTSLDQSLKSIPAEGTSGAGGHGESGQSQSSPPAPDRQTNMVVVAPRSVSGSAEVVG
eukprot:TRINITY_DN32410_c0_g1_i2.p1 TRINITY_DN32410_c0_g1~~TRINITY_DN32410_c0_g1_i2.p1  ORF type:complete len:765 (+),score=207.17 TRINITY_DN32410_c0_g1_i2:98-2296(+)